MICKKCKKEVEFICKDCNTTENTLSDVIRNNKGNIKKFINERPMKLDKRKDRR